MTIIDRGYLLDDVSDAIETPVVAMTCADCGRPWTIGHVCFSACRSSGTAPVFTGILIRAVPVLIRQRRRNEKLTAMENLHRIEKLIAPFLKKRKRAKPFVGKWGLGK